MRKNKKIIIILFSIILLLLNLSCTEQPEDSFRFVFMTDIHITNQRNAVEGFEKAIEYVNNLQPEPDFVLTGGDLIMDALGKDFYTADSLYTLYLKTAENFDIPVYNCIGNHEHFGIYKDSGVDPDHPEYSEKMYLNRMNQENSYFSFDHKGWHFVLLNSIGITPRRTYIGHIDTQQHEWLKKDLEKINEDQPVAVITHIPFYSISNQIMHGSLAQNDSGLVIINAHQVMETLKPYNLKLVLQGHLHIVEELIWKNTHLITAGAVSGAWWNGPYHDFEEGFAVVDIEEDEFTWEYMDYGWEAEEE